MALPLPDLTDSDSLSHLYVTGGAALMPSTAAGAERDARVAVGVVGWQVQGHFRLCQRPPTLLLPQHMCRCLLVSAIVPKDAMGIARLALAVRLWACGLCVGTHASVPQHVTAFFTRT